MGGERLCWRWTVMLSLTSLTKSASFLQVPRIYLSPQEATMP